MSIIDVMAKIFLRGVRIEFCRHFLPSPTTAELLLPSGSVVLSSEPVVGCV